MLFQLWKLQSGWLFDLSHDVINEHVHVKMTQTHQARVNNTDRLC